MCMISSVSEIAEVLRVGADAVASGRGLQCGFTRLVMADDAKVSILLTDSRSLSHPTETLFFALRTKGNDGHRYIESLCERGVKSFVVNEIPASLAERNDLNFIVVDDTLAALQCIGKYSRRRYESMLVAVAGSRGKTTIKEWAFQLLSPDSRIVRSPRSYNSQIGVPLSLWELDESTELAIIEAGISDYKEMYNLEAIIAPDVVVLTNLSYERGDRFLSLEDKAEQEAVLMDSARCVVYNADCRLQAEAVARHACGQHLMSWSRTDKSASLYVSNTKQTPDNQTVIDYTYNDVSASVVIPFSASYDVENAINCLALMLLLGKDKSVIAERMSHLTAVGTRLDVSDGVNGCTLIYDTYTSDCRSLWQALDFMGRRATGDCTRTLILSDMPGDGDSESHSFERVAEMCRRANIDRFIGIGEQLMASAHLFGTNASFFASTDEFMRSMSTSDFSNELILIKGAPQFDFKRIQDNLEARKHETVLEVNLDSVVKNYNYFRQHLPTSTGLVAMVKASGYGAGSYEIAKTLQAQGAAYLAVAVLDEGIDLRKAGITMPIMVMNPKVVNYKSMFTFHLEPEIYSIAMLKDVIREAEKYGVENYPVHIKLDTGMHRMGFLESELEHVMEILNAQNHVVAASVFSHLATADCPDMDDYTLMQLQCFDRLTDYMQSRYPRKIKRHVLNSAGIIRFPQYHYDMARLGIGLYGANTLPPEIERPLAVVSTLRTVIIAIREWDEGESMGYARRGMLGRKSRIATIPIGYADGMNRRLGNGRSRVYINGQYAPTAGNICMVACMIDVTDVPCKEGDIVEIFGENVSVQELADVLETIPYEVLTSVSPRVKRVYFRE